MTPATTVLGVSCSVARSALQGPATGLSGLVSGAAMSGTLASDARRGVPSIVSVLAIRQVVFVTTPVPSEDTETTAPYSVQSRVLVPTTRALDLRASANSAAMKATSETSAT